MSHANHNHVAGEARRSHQIQIGLFIFFLIVWILDSFLLRITPLVYLVPLYLNVIPGIIIIIGALVLMQKSHIVFEGPEPHVVTTNVYSRVRHPMYLGSILLYFGFWITTLSMITLFPLLCVIIGYNYLANAEERLLKEKFGVEYLEYKKRVGKWIP
ncbi:MAG: methyltransferase family protein [Candidatus Odinarchaeota archaeon]